MATRDGQPSICFPGDREAGEVCRSEVECKQELVCLKAEGEAQGTCATTCDSPGGLCGSGELCLPSGGDASVCVAGGAQPEGASCQMSAECARGLRCLGSGDESLCVRACERDDQCQQGMACEALKGDSPGSVCRPSVGAACVSDTTCPASTVCSTSFEDPFFFANLWPDGACSQASCTQGSCMAGSTCRVVGEAGSVCAPTCESDAQCRVTQGWRCLDASVCGQGKAGCLAYFGQEKLCHRTDRVWVVQ